jgi:tRNA(fMet)-specific endonuclease VapC
MMLRYMLDTSICIDAIRKRPILLRDRFNRYADQLCISVITLAELIYGAEKSARPHENLNVVEQFRARLDVLAFADPRG